MTTILLASIVWLMLILSNLIVGWAMYRLGLNGRLNKLSSQFMDDEDVVVDKVSRALGHIPGSEYNPFETQPESRYKDYAPDPVVPDGGDYEDGEGEYSER